MYIDEVKYQPPDQAYHWLCALAIPDGSIQAVDASLSALATDYFGSPLLGQETEFHARDIVQGKGPYKGQGMDRRVELYKRLLDLIDAAPDIGRIEIRIDPAKMVATTYADKAFMFLVEKVDDYMGSLKSLALLIADEDKEIAGQNVRSLSAYKARGTDYAFGRPITRVVDTIHHTRSQHSRLLQLADVYVYTLATVAGDCTAYPRSAIATHAKSKENLLFPTKYKNWPTDDSWYAST